MAIRAFGTNSAPLPGPNRGEHTDGDHQCQRPREDRADTTRVAAGSRGRQHDDWGAWTGSMSLLRRPRRDRCGGKRCRRGCRFHHRSRGERDSPGCHHHLSLIDHDLTRRHPGIPGNRLRLHQAVGPTWDTVEPGLTRGVRGPGRTIRRPAIGGIEPEPSSWHALSRHIQVHHRHRAHQRRSGSRGRCRRYSSVQRGRRGHDGWRSCRGGARVWWQRRGRNWS